MSLILVLFAGFAIGWISGVFSAADVINFHGAARVREAVRRYLLEEWSRM